MRGLSQNGRNMRARKTRDPLFVKEFLGHTKLDSTLLYIQLERALYKEANDEFTVKVARTPEEIKSLLEVGFEYSAKRTIGFSSENANKGNAHLKVN